MLQAVVVFLLVTVAVVSSQNNRDWHVGVDRVNPRGTVVHGHVGGPLHQNPSGRLDGNLHGSRVFGGPHNGAQTVGGGLNYQHNNGLHGGVDATHSRGNGMTYTGTVGGSTRVGPGTLSVDGGARKSPGSRVEGYVGGKYTVPF